MATATIKTVEKRRMCPNCRAFITITDRVCPYCNVQLGPRAVDMRGSEFIASFLPRANLTAVIIVAINVAFFLVELAVNYRLYKSFDIQVAVGIALGAEIAPYVQHGQWWRLLTAGFLHGGFLHIALNCWSIFVLVTEVEQFYGTSRLLVAYIFSTFTGFLCAYLFSPGGWVVGASAPAFGMIGIMLAMGLRQRADPLSQAVRSHYGQWLIFGLVMSLGGGISMAGHIGGCIGGFLVGLIAGLPGLPGTPREAFWKGAAVFGVLIMLYAWVESLRFFSPAIRAMTNT
ncbi:MAG TPA: rhomboid family intramembrane serine protease [Bryobacteraceae bacterium]